MKGWGIFLIIVGIICAFIAITMDTSVETNYGNRVHNLGLMNLQSNLLISAGISFISGILLIGFNSKSGSSSSEAVRICPYCAEQVKVQAKICRFCQKDLPVSEPDSPVFEPEPPNLVTSSLPQKITMLREEGVSYYMIAWNFNKQNVPIPESHFGFQTWTPGLVKLVEFGN